MHKWLRVALCVALVGVGTTWILGQPTDEKEAQRKTNADQPAPGAEGELYGNWCPTGFFALVNGAYYHVAYQDGTMCATPTYVPATRLHTCAQCPACPDKIVIAEYRNDPDGPLSHISNHIPLRKAMGK